MGKHSSVPDLGSMSVRCSAEKVLPLECASNYTIGCLARHIGDWDAEQGAHVYDNSAANNLEVAECAAGTVEKQLHRRF